MPAFSSCRQNTSGFSRSRNSQTCAARARMPLTFQVAIFINWAPASQLFSTLVPLNNCDPGSELRAFDDLQLVVDASHAVHLRGDLRGAAALRVALDGAPQAHLAV